MGVHGWVGVRGCVCVCLRECTRVQLVHKVHVNMCVCLPSNVQSYFFICIHYALITTSFIACKVLRVS